MLTLKKNKKLINIVIEDYVIRVVESSGNGLSAVKLLKELPLPFGLIDHGKITDEIAFYELMTDLVKELGLKNRPVRFYVPNPLVIMRQVEFPASVKEKDIHEHFEFELGKSIHLPFKQPVFDVHAFPQEPKEKSNEEDDIIEVQEEMRKGTLFAAPEEELLKFTSIFDDVSLKPTAADVEALGVYRYFNHLQHINKDLVYMFVELNVTSLTSSIFFNHQVQFLRYQDLDLTLKGFKTDEETEQITWIYEEDNNTVLGVVEDQVPELERIMNFYRFSVAKDNRVVDEIVVVGDHPHINHFHQSINQHFEIPSTLVKGYISRTMDKEVDTAFIPALGLALKGGATNAPEINLLPKYERESSLLYIIFISGFAIILLLFAILIFLYFGNKGALEDTEAELSQLNEQKALLEARLASLESNDVVTLEDVVHYAQSYKVPTSKLIDELLYLLPQNAYISNYSYNFGSVNIETQFETMDDAAEYIGKLKASNNISNVNISYLNTFDVMTIAEENPYDVIPRYSASFSIEVDQANLKRGE